MRQHTWRVSAVAHGIDEIGQDLWLRERGWRGRCARYGAIGFSPGPASELVLPLSALLILALALAMDAFAVALFQGAVAKPRLDGAVLIALLFGLAQGAMALIGATLSDAFASRVAAIDHWVALILLAVLGGRMIWNAAHHGPGVKRRRLKGWPLVMAALATSVDSAAAGVTLPLLGQPILTACLIIGGITAILCYGGVLLGRAAGTWLGRWAELAGGLTLVALGIKIFVEHQFLGG